MGIEHAVKRQDKPGEVKGLYIHPSLIDPLAIWASSDYAAYFFNKYYVSNYVSPADSKRSSEEDPREDLPVVKEDVGEDSGDDRSRNDERYPETEPHPSAPQKDWNEFYHYALLVTRREEGKIELRAVRRNDETFKDLERGLDPDDVFFHVSRLPFL